MLVYTHSLQDGGQNKDSVEISFGKFKKLF